MPTRKIAIITLKAHFEGDYISTEAISGYLDDWIESGLIDRDALVGYTTELISLVEEELNDNS